MSLSDFMYEIDVDFHLTSIKKIGKCFMSRAPITIYFLFLLHAFYYFHWEILPSTTRTIKVITRINKHATN